MAGTSDFYKYYGKIESGLKKGKYTININNKWNSNQFGGNKYIVISTASGYGGKNTSLETLYWICTALSLAFVVILKVQRILNNMKIKGKDMP